MQAATPVETRIYGQEGLFQTIRDSMTLDALPHIFLTGPSGCGKTTFLEDCIELFRKEAPFTVESVLWLSSEKDRGIHTIRDKVNDFCRKAHARPNSLRFIVIDDADTLPLISQQALRRPMETFNHLTRFLFASRHESNLIEPLRSRCQTFELEPLSPLDAYPKCLSLLKISKEHEHPQLHNFCIQNCMSVTEMKKVLVLYKAACEEENCEKALEICKSILPTSKEYSNLLIQALITKNVPKVIRCIKHFFLNGFLLDDILLSIERNISLFPSTDPESRFLILQFVMLGWISIQQGREHWLDTMDVLDQTVRSNLN